MAPPTETLAVADDRQPRSLLGFHQVVATRAALDQQPSRSAQARILRTRNASASREGALHSMPRNRSSDQNASSLNHCRLACDENTPSSRLPILSWQTSCESGTNTLGRPRSSSYFMISSSGIVWSRQVFQVNCKKRRCGPGSGRRRGGSEPQRCDRAGLYAAVYNELFRRVPDHPQIARKSDPTARAVQASRELQLVARFIGPGTNYLEIGAGDCRNLAFAVTGKVIHVYAIDVSDEISKQIEPPPNFELIISDGISIPVPAGSIDFAYSNQLMEHLHPDDAKSQLENVFTALRPGRAYLCITPNRLLAQATYRLTSTKNRLGFI